MKELSLPNSIVTIIVCLLTLPIFNMFLIFSFLVYWRGVYRLSEYNICVYSLRNIKYEPSQDQGSRVLLPWSSSLVCPPDMKDNHQTSLRWSSHSQILGWLICRTHAIIYFVDPFLRVMFIRNCFNQDYYISVAVVRWNWKLQNYPNS